MPAADPDEEPYDGDLRRDHVVIALADYASRDALGLADLIARREVTPQEFADAALAAIAKLNP